MKESKKDFPYIESEYDAVEVTVGRGQDLFEILEEALGGLHPEYRKAIELHYGLPNGGPGISYRKVARIMHVSPTTARRRVEDGCRELSQRDPSLLDKHPFVKSLGR